MAKEAMLVPAAASAVGLTCTAWVGLTGATKLRGACGVLRAGTEGLEGQVWGEAWL